MERFVQFPTGDNWTFTWDSPILWKQLNLARYLVLSTWYLVSGTGTWTQPVLGQDFTVLWLATLGRGILRGPDVTHHYIDSPTKRA